MSDSQHAKIIQILEVPVEALEKGNDVYSQSVGRLRAEKILDQLGLDYEIMEFRNGNYVILLDDDPQILRDAGYHVFEWENSEITLL